jgi:hypothetical protein
VITEGDIVGGFVCLIQKGQTAHTIMPELEYGLQELGRAHLGDRAAAAAAVPDELLLLAYPIGTEGMVRDRIRAYADTGVTGVRISPTGRTAAEQIEHLEQAVDVIRSATHPATDD